MSGYIEPYLLMVLGFFICNYSFSDISDILIALGAVIFISLMLLSKLDRTKLFEIALASLCVVFFPEALPFFSAAIYIGFYSRENAPTIGLALLALVSSLYWNAYPLPSLLVLYVFAGYWGRTSAVRDDLRKKIKVLRDSAAEREMILGQKNRQLLEMQQNQIHLATLTERNRIAREIHDNVGHQLSRAILQLGAIIAVTRDEQIKPLLVALKDTLDSAMNNIRNSVHDLHDESIDLESSVKKLCDDFNFCPVELHCETSTQVSKDVKYCFITIVKEALTNISKHSNASRASIYIHEHPGFFQLLISDNGSKAAASSEYLNNAGIGLTNMKDRVNALGGVIHFTNESGFKIFISIPKTDKEQR